ncbi:hypothetical protein LUZ60_005124 [Juncus effusus]|nr:hypothetical protein LUZ60_005124 [Juncus effusus]
MATEVGLMARLVNGYGKETDVKGEKDPITRDLLGGCTVMDAKELDLGLSIGSGSAMNNKGPLDILQPGKMYLLNNKTTTTTTTTTTNPLQDLNLPPSTFSLNIPQLSPNNSLQFPSNYQSVCTIEKVKSALERMGRESQSKSVARSDGSPSPSSSSITSSSPLKRHVDQIDGCDTSTSVKGESLMAAACPNCLLYVLISKENPKCPRCESHVSQPTLNNNNNNNAKNDSSKKMKIDVGSGINININTTLNLF